MTATQEILARLVGFDTVSARSNLALVDYVEDFLGTRGFRVTRLTDPDAPKAGLYAEIGPAGAGVLLSGHTDVVPVEGQAWTRDPFRLTREGDRLYGRGTTDMKGFVAAMLSAADLASRRPLTEPLKLVLSYDEEVGCVGIERMMPRLLPLMGAPRQVIVGEPTGMQVATGHKGKRAWRADITGEAGHSALAPRFVNAVRLAAEFVQALGEMQDGLAERGARDGAYDIAYSTLHVGLMQGGRALNIVPEHAEVRYELRYMAGDDPDAIAETAGRIAARHGPPAAIRLTPLAQYPGLDTDPASEVVRAICALSGGRQTKVAFGTEAGFFAGAGLPTVVCGPGSMAEQGHKADEFLDAGALAQCDAMLARLVETLSAER